ncbi:MAG: hypothetical protein J6N19_15315 [Clostridium sp.]|nr:hypothetical protein [Clostridium sp.]
MNDAILQALAGASEQAPVTAADLSWVTGLDERNVRMHVEALRREGNEICSNVNGYWIAKDKKDLDRFLAAYEAHAKSRLYTASRMRLHRQFEDDKERLERFREEWSNDPDSM